MRGPGEDLGILRNNVPGILTEALGMKRVGQNSWHCSCFESTWNFVLGLHKTCFKFLTVT